MIKLVALDLDGTIVNDKLEISSKTLKLLGHLIQNTAVRVVIATGRMYASALPFARQVGVVEPLITYQGAMIREFQGLQNILYHKPIAVPLAKQVLEVLQNNQFHANVYINDTLFTNHHNPHSTYYARMAGVTPVFSDSLLDAITEAPTKIMAIDDHRIDEMLHLLNQHFPEKLSYCRSRTNFCEVIDAAASKWNALSHLAEQWGIHPDEIMAIGDQENDISMIQHAGIGVAMGNAPEHVKKVANLITETIHEDGAARAIEQCVLGDFPLREHSQLA